MTNIIAIDKASRADIPIIIDFQQKLSEETEGESLDIAKVTAGVTAVFDDPSKGSYYIAKAEGRVVGCLIATYEWSDWGNAKVMWIASLYVEKSWRGKGVFKNFYAFLKQMVENGNEYRGIRLYVHESNFNARNAYEKIGMNGENYNLYEWMK